MKYCVIFLLILFTFGPELKAQTFPTNIIQNSGDINKRINYVYLGDGYMSSEQSTFAADAVAINNDMFSQKPFSNYKNFFNAYTISVPSNNSGADHPGTATDVNEPASPIMNVDTYFDSTFDFFSIHRLLVPVDNSNRLNSVLFDNVPQYDQAIVIVNSSEYGGSGGPIATSSTNQSANEVAIHEIGHSFAGLSDEYWAGSVFANENYNMTQETDPLLVKWAEWMGIQQVGIFDHCCGAEQASWKKPHQNCKMQFLGVPFCAVCTERIVDRIYELVQPIDDFTPSNLNQTHNGSPILFSLDLILPIPNTLRVEWELNGALVSGATSDNYLLNDSNLNDGANTLVARVWDETTLSKTYLPESGYDFFISWNVNYSNNFDPCVDDVIETNQANIGTNKQARFTIQTNGNVPASFFITYKAGQSISLLQEFEVKQGAVFSAYIEDCQ